MAGWTDSGSSRGRGGGGFANRGGANSNMNTRWRERRPAQLQQQHQHHQQQHQQQYQQHQHQQNRYRPVNDNDQSSQHRHHSPAEELNRHQGQGGFSSSTRRPQPTRPPQARPTFMDHKSPAPAANVSANANDNETETDDKARRNAVNFECNVCFEMADDPVVTKCGHLFCWECLYQWLHVHSHHRECPVCKGQVADDAIIPIYGRGGSAASVHAAPPRPTGARVESSRQQQQQHQAAVDWHMVDDDEDDNPFDDLHRLFGGTMLGNAMMSFMPEVTEVYGEYSNSPYHHNDFDEIHDFEILGSPVLASAGASSSWRHGHHTAFPDDLTVDSFFDNTTYPEPGYAYRGGRRQRGRARGGASADHSSMADMSSWAIGGSSSAPYRDTGAGGPHMNNTGGSSRPNGGWTERRGRSHRNSNSGGGGGGGRGSQNNSRRQGGNYN